MKINRYFLVDETAGLRRPIKTKVETFPKSWIFSRTKYQCDEKNIQNIRRNHNVSPTYIREFFQAYW